MASQWSGRHMTIWLFGYGMPPWHPSIKSTELHAFLALPGMQCAICQKILLPLPYCVLSDSFCCIVFFHKLLNIVEDILYLDWPQALSKCFCSFNNVLIVGTFCAPVKPFAWNHPWEIALSMVGPGKLSFEQGNSWITSCWRIYFYVSPYSQPFLAVTLSPGDCWKLACWGEQHFGCSSYVKVLAKPVMAGRAQSCCKSLFHASFFYTSFVCSG